MRKITNSTVRHGADRGYIPVVVTNACGARDNEAGERSLEEMKFTGDAVLTDVETICSLLKNTNNLKKLLLPTSYFLLTKFAYARCEAVSFRATGGEVRFIREPPFDFVQFAQVEKGTDAIASQSCDGFASDLS